MQAALKELETFSYSVSHDLRAPLRSMDGFSQALLEDYRQVLDERGKDYLQRIRRGSQRMAVLIDAMLDFARISRQSIKWENVNLSRIAGNIGEDMKKIHNHKVAFTVEPGLVCKGDRHLLTIALQNLIGNAWKFTAHKDEPKITCGQKKNNKFPTYYIEDNGVGFSMEYAHKLFQPFQRLHRETDFPGTGIGLATVEKIITRHRGMIWAVAEEGRGSTFFFTIGREG